MKAEDPTFHELGTLLATLVDAGLSADQRARLNAILRDHPEAKRFYQRYIELHAMLEWESGAVVAADSADDADTLNDLLRMESQAHADLVHQVGQLRGRHDSPWHISGAFRWVIEKPAVLAGIAAMLAMALILVAVFLNSGSNPSPVAVNPNTPTDSNATQPVATLTATHNAQWSHSAEGALAPGSPLKANTRLTLTTGFAEITTARGAIAIIEAPATIELLAHANAIHLHTGKLVGICETDSSKGFLVRTPHLDVTDIGTEFGVHAYATGVKTTVFSGEVEIETTTGLSHRLTNNQTARIDTTGDRPELIFEDRVAEGFARRIPRAGLVKMARINDDRFKVEVLAQGVVEGAKLFTDRRYILKVSEGQGIPAELKGGDLVRMPANARPPYTNGTENLQVELDLAEPATVYLLFAVSGADQSLPQWVTRDYEPTPLALTLAPDPLPSDAEKQAPNDFTLDTEQALRVWKRKQVASGQTVVAEQMQAWFSYTLVVVPEQAGEPTEQP